MTSTTPVALRVNSQEHRLDLDPRATLLDTLRERLGLTGTKKGCDRGECGACTVHLDGERALSCLMLAVMAEGREITTIEGLAGEGGALHPVQAAFIEHDAFQCGYCTPGQIMSAVACIREGHAMSESAVAEYMSGNICRCAAYPQIRAAVLAAAGTTRSAAAVSTGDAAAVSTGDAAAVSTGDAAGAANGNAAAATTNDAAASES